MKRSITEQSDKGQFGLLGGLVQILNISFGKISSQKQNEPWHDISNNVVCATSRGSDQPAHTRSLIRAFDGRLNIL